MTNSWNDIKNTDLVLIMGGNAAEAHPCGFKWVTEAKANNGAKLIVVDPRFTRSAAVADVYAPIRPGTDIAFLSGVMRYLLANGKIHREDAKAYTNDICFSPQQLVLCRGLRLPKIQGIPSEKCNFRFVNRHASRLSSVRGALTWGRSR